MSYKIIPIILSGGEGSRLWPISRRSRPKPFLQINGMSLLSHALRRAKLISNDIIIVTNEDHYHQTCKQINDLDDFQNINFLLEPESCNTALAIALALNKIKDKYCENAICVVLSADHLISDDESFKVSINKAIEEAEKGNLVVIGIPPTKPETGYGYIEVANKVPTPQKILSFVEKPSREIAEKFLSMGNYYWNSGIFCFEVGEMIRSMQLHAKDVWDSSKMVFNNSKELDGITNFFREDFINIRKISIDYAVMEKAKNICIVPANFEWSDLGNWDSYASAQRLDVNNNCVLGSQSSLMLNSNNTFIEQKSNIDKIVVTIGINDLVIIDTPDALLVTDRKESQEVKTAVEMLRAQNQAKYIETPSAEERPWGTYQILKSEKNYKVKCITIEPGQKISLQYHSKRSEHWVVTSGLGIVQIGNREIEVCPGDHCFIPLGEIHRITNKGDDLLVFIEIQTGSYFGEDDIVRLEDEYARK